MIVNVPVLAELLAVRVRTLVFVAGLVPNDAVVPLPVPDADSVTLPAKPPEGVMVIVLVVCEPRVMLRLVGEAERVKLADAGGFTVSEIVVVCVMLPETPVIVTTVVPVVAVLLAVSVSTLVLVVGFVLNDAVTPEGRGDAESVTLPVNPSTGFTVIVLGPPAPPCVIVTLAGDADRVKVGDDADGASVLIKPEPFGLPQPVARS